MTAVAEAMLEGLNENAVDFRENYDGTLDRSPCFYGRSSRPFGRTGRPGIAVGKRRPTYHRITFRTGSTRAFTLIKTQPTRVMTLCSILSRAPISPPVVSSLNPLKTCKLLIALGKGGFSACRCRGKPEEFRPRANGKNRHHRNPLSKYKKSNS